MANALVKRKWVYVQRPKEYEISGCPTCGNSDPDWSEWEGHLWCPVCEKDFVPESGGVFDGPIPIQTAQALGLDFRQYNVTTGEVRDLGEEAQRG